LDKRYIVKIEEIVGLDRRLGELRRISRSLRRLSENACKYGLTPRQKKREENLEKKAEKLADELGFQALFQGDPGEGCALYLLPKGISREEAELNYPPKGFAIF